MSQVKSEPDKTSPESEQERLFASHANAAWGMAFVTTEAVSSATDAVADGFAGLFQALEYGNDVDDLRFEVLRLTRAAALRRNTSDAGTHHAREAVSMLGETKDRQATLALASLGEPARSLLWLVDAQALSLPQASSILEMKQEAAERALTTARSDFRRFSVDAARTDQIDEACSDILESLAAYSDHTLDHDGVARVDAHLIDCDACRNLTARLTDLETRVQSAVPAIPAWTRQYVIDTWLAVANSAALFDQRPPRKAKAMSQIRGMAYAAAGVVVVMAIALALANPGSDSTNLGESASSKLSAPATTTTTLAVRDQSAVVTPRMEAEPTTSPPTGAPATTTSTAPSPEPSNTRRTTPTPRAPATEQQPTPAAPSAPAAPPAPAPTEQPSTAGNGLVDLPPTPVATAQ